MVKIYQMRHAESMANESIQKIKNLCSDRVITAEKEDKQIEDLKMSMEPEILNSKLSERGVKQAKKAYKNNKSKLGNIRHVVVSPLRRTIQTFENTFEEMASFKDSTIKVHIVEDLREALLSSSELAFWGKHEQEDLKYSNLYDFSFLNDTSQHPDKNFWVFDNLMPEYKENAHNLIKNCQSLKEKCQQVCKTFSNKYSKDCKLENTECIYRRVARGKDIVRQIIKDNNIKDKELLVVSHGNTLSHFTGREYQDNFMPKKFKMFDNAEIIKFELEI